jgi:hypothetical protein
MFKFFFADEDLMYDTIGVKLYESIFMVDFVMMITMVQTHPHYKGLHIGRKTTIDIIAIAAFIALLLGLLFAMKVEAKNAAGFMMFVSILSIFIYPLSATLINYVSYKKPTLAVIIFGVMECLKFTLLDIMKEGLREIIIDTHKNKAENFKAFGAFVGSIFKALSFGIFGWFITKAMKSFRIQKLNPFNYFFAFLILALPLIISWMMLRKAKAIKEGQK